LRGCQNALRLQQVGPVDHTAIEAHHPCRGRAGECGDHSLCMLALGLGGRKRGVDRRNLIRMDCQLATESVATRPQVRSLPPSATG